MANNTQNSLDVNTKENVDETKIDMPNSNDDPIARASVPNPSLTAMAMEYPRASSNMKKYIIFGVVGVVLLIVAAVTAVMVIQKSDVEQFDGNVTATGQMMHDDNSTDLWNWAQIPDDSENANLDFASHNVSTETNESETTTSKDLVETTVLNKIETATQEELAETTVANNADHAQEVSASTELSTLKVSVESSDSNMETTKQKASIETTTNGNAEVTTQKVLIEVTSSNNTEVTTTKNVDELPPKESAEMAANAGSESTTLKVLSETTTDANSQSQKVPIDEDTSDEFKLYGANLNGKKEADDTKANDGAEGTST